MTKSIWCSCLCIAAFATTPSSAAIILNGSFESPVAPVGSDLYLPDQGSLPSWEIVNNVAVINGSFTQFGITFQAQAGAQWMDVTGVVAVQGKGVRQIVDTVSGQAYDLTFYVGSASNGFTAGDQIVAASLIDVEIDAITSPVSSSPILHQRVANSTAPTDHLDWKQFVVQFVATSDKTSIAFLSTESTSQFAALDNVSIAEAGANASVPEPATFTLWGLGALALGIFRRRRQPTG